MKYANNILALAIGEAVLFVLGLCKCCYGSRQTVQNVCVSGRSAYVDSQRMLLRIAGW